MPARLLMIALDAADGRLLDEWSGAGVLPNLAALRARGVVRRLTASEGITDDAIWASFQAGVGLGEHGRYHFTAPVAPGVTAGDGEQQPFWAALSDAGFRVAILDVPKCPRPQPLNGIQLADWLVHGRTFPEPLSYPPALAGDILARFGPAPPSRCDYRQDALGDEDVREIVRNLRTGIAMKREAALHYLDSGAWDLFLVGFKEAHCAGHGLWNFADGDTARSARLGEPLRTIFVDLDAAIGALVEAAGPEAEIVVFSTSDMVPNGSLDHLLPEIVERVNVYLRRRFTLWWERPVDALRRALRRPSRRVWTRLTYNENFGALRLKHLPRHGVAALDHQVIEATERLLRGLVDAETGEAAIVDITRPAAEHSGRRAAALPNLLLHYRPSRFPKALVSPELGRIAADPPRLRPGNHAPGGLLIAVGEAVAAGASDVDAMEDFGGLTAAALRRHRPGSMKRAV